MYEKCAQLVRNVYNVTYAILLPHIHKYQPPGCVIRYPQVYIILYIRWWKLIPLYRISFTTTILLLRLLRLFEYISIQGHVVENIWKGNADVAFILYIPQYLQRYDHFKFEFRHTKVIALSVGSQLKNYIKIILRWN